MIDDAPLIQATLAGDTAAYGRLVERHQDRLYNAVYRFLGSAEDSRDVVQDAFVQAFLKLETFRGTAAFYTWLYRIAFNLAASLGRRKRITTSLDQIKDGCGSEPTDGQPGPDAGLVAEERSELLHRALGELSDESRAVLVLREMESCSYEQIAEILEVPIGTVRSRLFRARMQLRERLAPVLHETPDEVRQRAN